MDHIVAQKTSMTSNQFIRAMLSTNMYLVRRFRRKHKSLNVTAIVMELFCSTGSVSRHSYEAYVYRRRGNSVSSFLYLRFSNNQMKDAEEGLVWGEGKVTYLQMLLNSVEPETFSREVWD